MTVVDIRTILADRNIQLSEVNADCIYYLEEKNEDGHNNLFILEYDRSSKKERLVANYSLEDPTFVEHMFVFRRTILLVLENGSNSLWLIELDKKNGMEKNRRKIVCTGSFKECMALDQTHLLIYMSPDSENAEMFRKYKEVTGCDCLCYLYDLENNRKHFVKSSLVARTGCRNIRVMEVKGEKYVLLLDPYADESLKETYYKEQRWIHSDIRDNIWLCRLEELEKELETGKEIIRKRCIASADIKALVRYMGMDSNKIYFRAKEFKSGTEKICSYDAAANHLEVETTLHSNDDSILYIVEEKPFKLFSVLEGVKQKYVKGLVNSQAELEYDSEMGEFMSCMDDRYIIANRVLHSTEDKTSFNYCFIYDTQLDKYESYSGSSFVKENTLVLY